MDYQQPVKEENLSADLLGNEAQMLNAYVYATTGQRFLNFLIDNLLMNYGLSYLTGYLVGEVFSLVNPGLLQGIITDRTYILFLGILIAYFNYIIYYSLCKKIFNGYTLGKIITGTRAIREDGQPLTFKNALIRTLCRLVPFEAFSGFQTRPW